MFQALALQVITVAEGNHFFGLNGVDIKINSTPCVLGLLFGYIVQPQTDLNLCAAFANLTWV